MLDPKLLDALLMSLFKVHTLGNEAASFMSQGADPVAFLDQLDLYLKDLELWQGNNKKVLADISEGTISIPEDKREVLRATLDDIKHLHSVLMKHSQGLMEEVHSELGSINKRAQGIRKYVDTMPSRVSVTPKKSG